eukprot:11173269-Lingulodinium_polyedra.AAC.1
MAKSEPSTARTRCIAKPATPPPTPDPPNRAWTDPRQSPSWVPSRLGAAATLWDLPYTSPPAEIQPWSL